MIHLQLFPAEKDASGKTWKTPVLLAINNKDHSIGHPAISSDGLNLYFSSNKPGGYGGTDLYVSQWVNNTWSAPENLGAVVNTEGNEMFPYLAADTTLYFASNGHAGLGASIQGAIEMLEKIKAMRYNDAFVRREARYTELSKKPGVEVEKLYKH